MQRLLTVFALVASWALVAVVQSKERLGYNPTASFGLFSASRNSNAGLYYWLRRSSAANAPVDSDILYLRLSWLDLVGEDGFDFSPIEKALTEGGASARIAFRIFALNSCFSSYGGFDIPAAAAGEGSWIAPSSGADSVDCKNKRVLVPDWNSAAFISGATQLIRELGSRYNGHRNVAFVEIGLVGDWGEWHLGSFPYCDLDWNRNRVRRPSEDLRRKIIDEYVSAFPDTQLLMLSDDVESLLYALSQNTRIPIGIRRDSWGSAQFNNSSLVTQWVFSDDASVGGKCRMFGRLLSPELRPLIFERWKKAPVVVESFGGQFARALPPSKLVDQVRNCKVSLIANGSWGGAWSNLPGLYQAAILDAGSQAGFHYAVSRTAVNSVGTKFELQTWWSNLGTAPTYEDWDVFVRVFDVRSQIYVAHLPLSLNLRMVFPRDSGSSCLEEVDVNGGALRKVNDGQAVVDGFAGVLLPELALGDYEVRISVVKRGSSSRRMKLLLRNENSDGSYTVGKLKVDGD